ncbi:MAG: hypothetical protein ACT4PL_01250 [Phycisphaerales bacterium]
MSQISATHGHDDHGGHHGGHSSGRALATDNIYAPEFARPLSMALIGLGVFGILGCVAFGLMASDKGGIAVDVLRRHGAAAFHVGAIIALGLTLGPLGIIMIFNQVAAGWAVTIRRQLENMAAMTPVAVVMALISAAIGPWTGLWHWMHIHDDLGAKGLFLNTPFFYARVVLYAVVWIWLSARLNGLSRTQDASGDKSLSAKAKFTSAYGLLMFALSVAFGGFDLVMTLDHHWFSTMFPIYFFAGNMIASLSLTAILLALLRGHGKMDGLATPEHFHDLGKLMLGFTVFWAYIAFSQYFLIWYAAIPEETAWFEVRLTNGWENFGKILMFGHFVGPFLVLLFRKVKRTSTLLALVGLWQLGLHALDIFWQIRPDIYKGLGTMGLSWVDVAGLLGCPCLILGLLLMKVRAGPLIPIKDPLLHEALEHKNYV